MNSKSKLVLSNALILVILFHFQNCSAPPPSEAGTSDSSDQVGIVTDLRPGEKVAFMEQEMDIMQLEVNSMYVIAGLCDRELRDTVLSWEIVDSQTDETATQNEATDQGNSAGDIYASGETACSVGSFHIELADITQMACNSPYQVHVKLNGELMDSAIVLKSCM